MRFGAIEIIIHPDPDPDPDPAKIEADLDQQRQQTGSLEDPELYLTGYRFEFSDFRIQFRPKNI